MNLVKIIAEIGVNHNGSFLIAKKMIDICAKAGVDIVKFQIWDKDLIATKYAQKARYQMIQKQKYNTQKQMLDKLLLSFEEFYKLSKYCKEKNVEFLATAFDIPSINFLNKLNVKRFKIPSGEINNLPLLNKISKQNKPILLSTGMSNLSDIERCLEIIEKNFYNRNNVTLLHCTSQYPTEYENVNLSAIKTLKNSFKLNIGYSDHTLGIEIALAAVALGATVIEKHITLDKNFEGPDHLSSIEPAELEKMVKSIRNIEKSFGDGLKKLLLCEKDILMASRKSIVAKVNIKKGQLFTNKNLALKRPATGLSPMKWYEILNTISTRKYKKDDNIIL